MADGPAERLARWLDNPEEAVLFTRRDIADLALLLSERKRDIAAVHDVIVAAMPEHDLSPDLDLKLSLLYTRFHDRLSI